MMCKCEGVKLFVKLVVRISGTSLLMWAQLLIKMQTPISSRFARIVASVSVFLVRDFISSPSRSNTQHQLVNNDTKVHQELRE